jgi:soluble lytic murein transglycosylase
VRERLALAESVGDIAGDWPLAMLLVFGLDRSVATQSVLQRDPRYPAAAYPPVYREVISAAAGNHAVPPELLYAVMRRESLFLPAAVSRRGALGLFQFIPSTFRTLDERWRLLDRSGATSMEGFIRDPDLSIDLGARWFKEELLARNDGDILLAVMEHNAGYPAVKTWRDGWERSGHMGDVEYMIETARFTETRIFARSVLADIAVAGALGLFEADEAGNSR